MAPEGLQLLQAVVAHRRLLAAVSICAAVAGTSPAAAGTVEYLHIEANAGGSSGGHTALCFEDACYHYQQAREGLLRLHREPPASLDHAYRMLGNRTINAVTIAIDEREHARLLGAFESRFQVQEAQLDLLDELDRDTAFLAVLNARAGGSPTNTRALRVPGTGYFSSEPLQPDGLAACGRCWPATGNCSVRQGGALNRTTDLARMLERRGSLRRPAGGRPRANPP